MIISRPVRRLAAVGILSSAITVANLTSAAAHVTVRADSAYAGTFSALTFRVPNESATAGTVKLVVTLPQGDQPFLYVSTKPVPGWRATPTEQPLPKPVQNEGTTITKAVRTVTWTADRGTRIEPGEYQDFSISVGPLPRSGTVVLPAVQTYSDGTVVRWNQPMPASGPEPEHPAPQFQIKPQEVVPANPPALEAAASTVDPVGRLLSGGALVVAVVAVVLAALNRRSRRSSSP